MHETGNGSNNPNKQQGRKQAKSINQKTDKGSKKTRHRKPG